MCLFIHMILVYGYKFSNMGIQGKCVSFYLYGSFLWLQIFKYWYAKKICVFLFIWFFFIVTNFQILVCKENVFLFISMVLFYGYKFSNMDVQGNESSFFTWNLKVCPKSVVQSRSKTHYSQALGYGRFNNFNLSRELTKPLAQRIMSIYWWKPLTASCYIVMFDFHWFCASGDITYLISHVPLPGQVIDGLCEIMGGSTS